MLSSSHAEVPASKEAQNASGIPWSVSIDLLAQPPTGALRPSASFERCQHCFAYINRFCVFERKQWMCSLCGEYNALSAHFKDPAERLERAELKQDSLDFELPQDPPAVPAVLLIVDVTGDKIYLDALKSGVQAAIEGLSDSFYVGLITVGAKVGVFQLNSSVPLVKSFPLTHAGELSLSLDEALDFMQIFVPKPEAQKHFSLAAESLSELAEVNPAHCFGTAISAVIDYLTLRSTLVPVTYARIVCFLSSAPSYGLGALAPAVLNDVRATSNFYTDIAAKAAKVGSRIDLIGLGRSAFGFAQMRVLSQLTCGSILLYPELQAASTLPQDLYRLLSGHQGLSGILRLRTTAEVEQESYLGNVYPSPSSTNLFHVAGCDQFSSLLYALRVNSPLGEKHPVLQLAFAFYHVPPNGPPRRVLRVHTIRLPVSKNWHSLYAGIEPEVVGAYVVQKVLKHVAVGGFAQAALVLDHWVLTLVSSARRHASWNPDAIDSATGGYVLPSVEQVLRFCFAFTKCGLLAAPQQADQWIYAAHLLSGVSRRLVRRYICPLILPFSDSLEAAGSCLPLNRISLTVSPVLVMEAYSTVIVLYTNSASNVPYPPPKDSSLREALAALTADRPITPTVTIGRVGAGTEQTLFESYLLEDAPDRPYHEWLPSLRAAAIVP